VNSLSTSTIARRILAPKEIFERIEIRDPYYALDDVTLYSNGMVTAKIPVEQPLGMEIPPITAAEAARHLAILGSCAIALTANFDKEKHFYLALKGDMKRIIYKEMLKKPDYLYGVATVQAIDKRKALVTTELMTTKDEVIYKMDVEYYILTGRLFARQYQMFQQDLILYSQGKKFFCSTGALSLL